MTPDFMHQALFQLSYQVILSNLCSKIRYLLALALSKPTCTGGTITAALHYALNLLLREEGLSIVSVSYFPEQ